MCANAHVHNVCLTLALAIDIADERVQEKSGVVLRVYVRIDGQKAKGFDLIGLRAARGWSNMWSVMRPGKFG
ncbi:hypothetical protein ACLOJK_032959 [Asimina triloba]